VSAVTSPDAAQLTGIMKAPKVNFLVIGTQKSGTTALDHYLRQHRDIGMADVKEVHYFDDEDAFARKPEDHAAYEAHFPGSEHLHGETTPIYLWWRPARERIHRYNPAMKLIAVLRDPAERAFSHWNMEVNRGDESRDFMTCLREEREGRAKGGQAQDRVRSYADRGFYAEQIERFLGFFPKEQLLFLRYEDFRDHPAGVMAEVHSFLGVDRHPRPLDRIELNKGSYRTAMTAEQRQVLLDMLRDDIGRTEKLLGWDLSGWLAG
jgi:hypothetical protein